MSDIFISYASEDRNRIEPLAKALAAQGWSVWWDREVPFGRDFDEIIEEGVVSRNPRKFRGPNFRLFLGETFHNWSQERKVVTVNHDQIMAEWA